MDMKKGMLMCVAVQAKLIPVPLQESQVYCQGSDWLWGSSVDNPADFADFWGCFADLRRVVDSRDDLVNNYGQVC